MRQRNAGWLVLILLVVAFAAYVVITPGLSLGSVDFNWTLRQGLDLQGGLKVLLEADVPAGQVVEKDAMDAAKAIIENRVNALGVSEPLVQTVGENRISVELPGATNAQEVINLLKQTALLEFVYIPNAQTSGLTVGSVIATDCYDPTKYDCGGNTPPASSPTATPGPTPTLSFANPFTPTPIGGSAEVTSTEPITPTGPTYDAIMTGVALQSAVAEAPNAVFVVNFTLTPQGSELFANFTTAHVGEVVAIVVDKQIISMPRIDSAITGGQGVISGQFDNKSANDLAIQLRYGSLPVPLKVAQSSEVGPTLGQDSIRKSLTAGIIGISVVILFMLFYYRLPGVIASVALLIYTLISVAIFEMYPITLTLPGIAGFVLSVGVAVDANILIFERMKEELRAGKDLRRAVDVGFNRAFPSIRDSNISTLITCAILYWFGLTFGASIVQGFAITLALGVGVSLFTAILVTRTILHYVLDGMDFSKRHSWFGI